MNAWFFVATACTALWVILMCVLVVAAPQVLPFAIGGTLTGVAISHVISRWDR